MEKQTRTALVTGASSGIGAAIAAQLVADGFVVFGGSRKPAPKSAGGVEPLVLDVTDDASVEHAVETVVRVTGRLDVVVNNAGATLVGALEETTSEEARWLFETNVLGVHRVTRAALPHLRASHGHVVIIGSIAGFLAKPGEGFYCATKHALEGYFDVLRVETGALGVRTALVQPGFVKTKLAERATSVQRPLALYDGLRSALRAGLHSDVAAGVSPELVAECVSRIVSNPAPNARYLVGKEAAKLRWLKTALPTRLFEWALRRRFSAAYERLELPGAVAESTAPIEGRASASASRVGLPSAHRSRP